MKKLFTFKSISYAEGVSFLVLLLIAMPIKYLAGNPMPVKIFGWAHGVLFILYMIAAVQSAENEKWSKKTLMEAMLMAFLPFGPFYFHRKHP